MLRLALPSNVEWQEPTLTFLESCGLPVERPDVRRYTAAIRSLPGANVLFQRVADIPLKVEEGRADLGIAGLDRYRESHREDGDGIILIEDLGFQRCELVIGVPDSWIDVSSLADLVDLSLEFREQGKQLRAATKYPRLVQQFFLARDLRNFTLVEAAGAMEAAPAMGYADIIADISSSGTTLRENRLKTLTDGTILTSQACLIANKRLVAQESGKLSLIKTILEFIEARLMANLYYNVTANLKGETAEEVAQNITSNPKVSGMQGPTIARVYSKGADGGSWYAATVVVERDKVMEVVEYLRRIGGNGITVSPMSYVFEDTCRSYQRLLSEIAKGEDD